ncbi:hypothetical protein H1P_6600008 [Hyella patelloides LEGE 07179]|uniref:Uncharacterized protein n=1 Tax=Hyella patelloides LEGE 07179 TaxID=945734 RepID=A0A563W2M3_9CYAN|nr:hypothetical protein H1P_6600008 [Hyella patelloides LEGE 07179]
MIGAIALGILINILSLPALNLFNYPSSVTFRNLNYNRRNI